MWINLVYEIVKIPRLQNNYIVQYAQFFPL